jgi:hypothetical protein
VEVVLDPLPDVPELVHGAVDALSDIMISLSFQ